MRAIAARTLGAVCRPSPQERLCFSPSLVLRPPVGSNLCAHPQIYFSEVSDQAFCTHYSGATDIPQALTYDGDNPESCTVGPASFGPDKARMLETSS